MFTKTKFSDVESAAQALINIRTSAVAAGWTEDQYSAAAAELYLHNGEGQYFSLSVQADPYDETLEHLAVCGNTGFDASAEWHAQPGRYTRMAEIPTVNAYDPTWPVGVGPMRYRDGQTAYARLSALWLLAPLDQWVVADGTNVYVFFSASGYSFTGVADDLCLALWLGRIDRYDTGAGGDNGGAIVLSDQVGEAYYYAHESAEIRPSLSCLSGPLVTPADYRDGGYTWHTSFGGYGQYLDFTHNRGLLWDGANIGDDQARISSQLLPEWTLLTTFHVDYANRYPLLTTWDDSGIQIGFPEYNNVFDRATLMRPIIHAAVDGCVWPIGECPHYLIRDYTGITPGEVVSFGAKQYVTFPLFAVHHTQRTGVALRVA
jgi:hypothetical protein